MKKVAKANINAGLGTLVRPLKGLKEDPKNARKHDERNLSAIAASLVRYGQQKPIVVTEDGAIVAGNGTFRAAQALGWTQIAAVTFDRASEVERVGYAVVDNRSAELASWDDVILAEALQYLNEENDGNVTDLGFTEAEFIAALARLESESDEEERVARRMNDAVEQPSGPASNVRMVQLFLDDTTHAPFVEWCRRLAAQYGKTNLTDTVYEAIKRQHDALPALGEAMVLAGTVDGTVTLDEVERRSGALAPTESQRGA